jgi:hypothetical protein
VGQDHDALARAVRERAQDMGVTLAWLSERSRDVDRRHFGGDARKKPGLALGSWSEIQRGLPKDKKPHTQLVIDATLGWPRGTTRAHLYGEPLPSGPPLVPLEEEEVVDAASRADLERVRVEVAELRAEFADLSEAVHRLVRQRRLDDGT